uniref:Uncharacterized protein n=1 Tax=Oryza rufipogon TaxID=4529 RepID=A0A0E0R636_ORYRU
MAVARLTTRGRTRITMDLPATRDQDDYEASIRGTFYVQLTITMYVSKSLSLPFHVIKGRDELYIKFFVAFGAYALSLIPHPHVTHKSLWTQ